MNGGGRVIVKKNRCYMALNEDSQRKAHDVDLAECMTLSKDFIENFRRRYSAHILEILLSDRTTGKNIIWADNEYEALGAGYLNNDEITIEKTYAIKPRIAKESERQSQRTKNHAEVFTPSWLCNQMNNDADEIWFGHRDIFNVEEFGGEAYGNEALSGKEWNRAAGIDGIGTRKAL